MQQYYQSFVNLLPAFATVMAMQARCEAAAEPKPERVETFTLRQGLRFEHVSFRYDASSDTPVIGDLDLTIEAGQTTAIVGPSGAGKSTIADLVTGLLVPDQGCVCVDGKPLGPERMSAWREQIGYVTQETFLFHDTVRANLLWARPDASDADIRDALHLAAAEAFVSGLPNGLDTVIGDRGVLVSGGERQRLALARALLRRPSLLILDEATSSLDSENEGRIQRAIDELHGYMTILVITHRLSTVRRADVIYVLEQGRLVESGPWEVLLAKEDGRFRALCRAQGIDSEDQDRDWWPRPVSPWVDAHGS
jgi:ATP-binding cassette, subfamily C, bacterial